jgi:prevent-host-death family protein
MDVSATEFKARCLQLMDRVAEFGEEIVITKRGKAVARLVPVSGARREGSFGAMRGTARVLGDIVEPIAEAWEAEEARGDHG